MDKTRTYENKIIFWTKCTLLIMGLITAIPVANHLFRDVYKFFCVWGFLCVLYLFIKRRKNYWYKEYLLLLLFCCSYTLTILCGTREHLINEIAMLGYTGVLFFVLTYCDRKMSKEQMESELKMISWILVAIPFLFSLISFFMFVFSISGEVRLFGNVYTFGMYENRLWGLYNPNTGSTINFLSIMASVLLLKKTKKNKIFLWGNMVVQVLCLILTQSRGTGVCFFSFVAIYLFFVKKYKKDYCQTRKKVLFKRLIIILALTLMMGTAMFIKGALANVPVIVSKLDGGNISDSMIESAEHGLERLDKKENNIQSISTGRSDMWKIGIDAVIDEPILGIGFRNIDDVLAAKMSKDGYANSAAGGLHSVYITVLVSAGVVGFGIICLYLLCVLQKVLKCLLDKNEQRYVKAICALIPAILISELVESRIFFGMNIWAFMFWIIVGYVGFYSEKGENIDNSNRTSI